MSVFLENLAAEWEHSTVISEEEIEDCEVDTELFLVSALQIARLIQTEE